MTKASAVHHFHNGKIFVSQPKSYTLNSSLVVTGEKVAFVGSDKDAEQYIAEVSFQFHDL